MIIETIASVCGILVVLSLCIALIYGLAKSITIERERDKMRR